MRGKTESNEMGDKKSNANWVYPHLIIFAALVAFAMSGCNSFTDTNTSSPNADGDRVRASFIITENPARCECDDEGVKVTRDGFRAAIARLAGMPPGKELDLSVTTDYLCWKGEYPRDYERELSALSSLTNFSAVSLAVRRAHGELALSALAKLPLRHLTIDQPLGWKLPLPKVLGLESSSVEGLTLIGCHGVKGFCDLPKLKVVECKLDVLGMYEISSAEIRSRFPSVERVFGNGVYPPDLPPFIATNAITSLSYREWGALSGPDERYSIDFANRRVFVEVYNYRFLRETKNPCVLKGERLCLRKDWEKILACIEEVNIDSWVDNYRNPNICDGTLWQLELFSGTNVIRRIKGDNAAPPEFKKFCTVKQVAFDKFGGCSLWYPKQRDEMMKLIEAAEKKAETESAETDPAESL